MTSLDIGVKAARRERRGILVILLCLMVLAASALIWTIPREQQDLQRRSIQALERAGVDPQAVDVDFSGRDALLREKYLGAGSDLRRAQAVVARVDGVHKVIPVTVPRPSLPLPEAIQRTLALVPEHPNSETATEKQAGEIEPEAATVADTLGRLSSSSASGNLSPAGAQDNLETGSVENTPQVSAPVLSEQIQPLASEATETGQTPSSPEQETADTAVPEQNGSEPARAIVTSTGAAEPPAEVEQESTGSTDSPPLFAPGSSLLSADGYRRLQSIAADLRAKPGTKRDVDIYIENSGNPYLDALVIQHRRNLVIMALLQQGIHPSRVIVTTHIK